MHRDTPPAPLNFNPPLGVLLDDERCKMLSANLMTVGADWERARATVHLYSQLPDEGGVYMFVWAPELTLRVDPSPPDPTVGALYRFRWVLYVGRSGKGDNAGSVKQRYRTEYSKLLGRSPEGLWSPTDPVGRAARLDRYLTIQPLEFWCLRMKDAKHIARIERQLIEAFEPPLNDRLRKVRAHLTPVGRKPAFSPTISG